MNPASDLRFPGLETRIKVIGIGGAGARIVERLWRRELPGLAYAVMNTDAPPPSSVPNGCWLDVRRQPARDAAPTGRTSGPIGFDEHAPTLREFVEGTDVIFLVAGLGGMTGTELAPPVAQLARETGARVLAFVVTPFPCESTRRQQLARSGLAALRAAADGVLCLPNEALGKILAPETRLTEAFRRSDDLLVEGLCGVWRLLTRTGPLEIHLADLCAQLGGPDTENALATAEAAGPDRARDLVAQLNAHPVFDQGTMLDGAESILVSFVGGEDLTMAQIQQVMELVHNRCGQTPVLLGAALDPALTERLTVTVISTRRGRTTPASPTDRSPRPAAETVPAAGSDVEADHELVGSPTRVADASGGTAVAANARPRVGASPAARKTAPRLRQVALPLDIQAKSRFDKSEPTLHKGQNLDQPTYIRRRMVLN